MGLGVAASLTPCPFLCLPSSPSSFPHSHLRCPLRFPTVTSRKTLLLFTVPASARRQRKSGGAATSDDEGDGWLKEEAAAEAEAEADEELPLEEMRRWLRNKPTGFGEGKTYDTAVEEKLLEEIEQTRKAQLSIADKARKEPKKPEPVKKEVEVPSNICVRVGNLPRKKNIHRDLKLAFKGFIGIVNISPAVMGNHKTRDPICKGFAFLYLESEEVAFRFVHKYSKQNVLFGKVEKQITCDIINPQRSSDPTEQLARDRTLSNQSRLAKLAIDTPVRSENKNLSQNSQVSEGLTGLSEDDHTEGESRIEGTEIAIEYDSNLSLEAIVSGDDLDSNESISSSQKPRKQVASRKKKVKTKSVKIQKSSFSGSMVRLKMKERTVLTGVFSKYGGKVSQDLAKQS